MDNKDKKKELLKGKLLNYIDVLRGKRFFVRNARGGKNYIEMKSLKNTLSGANPSCILEFKDRKTNNVLIRNYIKVLKKSKKEDNINTIFSLKVLRDFNFAPTSKLIEYNGDHFLKTRDCNLQYNQGFCILKDLINGKTENTQEKEIQGKIRERINNLSDEEIKSFIKAEVMSRLFAFGDLRSCNIGVGMRDGRVYPVIFDPETKSHSSFKTSMSDIGLESDMFNKNNKEVLKRMFGEYYSLDFGGLESINNLSGGTFNYCKREDGSQAIYNAKNIPALPYFMQQVKYSLNNRYQGSDDYMYKKLFNESVSEIFHGKSGEHPSIFDSINKNSRVMKNHIGNDEKSLGKFDNFIDTVYSKKEYEYNKYILSKGSVKEVFEKKPIGLSVLANFGVIKDKNTLKKMIKDNYQSILNKKLSSKKIMSKKYPSFSEKNRRSNRNQIVNNWRR